MCEVSRLSYVSGVVAWTPIFDQGQINKKKNESCDSCAHCLDDIYASVKLHDFHMILELWPGHSSQKQKMRIVILFHDTSS